MDVLWALVFQITEGNACVMDSALRRPHNKDPEVNCSITHPYTLVKILFPYIMTSIIKSLLEVWWHLLSEFESQVQWGGPAQVMGGLCPQNSPGCCRWEIKMLNVWFAWWGKVTSPSKEKGTEYLLPCVFVGFSLEIHSMHIKLINQCSKCYRHHLQIIDE